MSSESSSSPIPLAVRARDLGKSYRLFQRPEDRLKDFIFGHWKKFHTDFWALRHLDLEIPHGSTVGIIGRNGSGKSTFLQMVCGTLSPTEGELTVNGRIAALLELGAGFNPQFTGRENVYMNAAILGLKKEDVEERFDAIAGFADIGEFIDAPVKTYSSGMFARLSFAVAINVDPDILVVDEALSVGDEAFQRRCYARIEQIREAGATVLFVSHSPGTIVDLCDHAILLDAGEKLLAGEPKEVVQEYQKLIYATPEHFEKLRANLVSRRDGDVAAETTEPKPEEQGIPLVAAGDEFFDPSFVSRSAVNHAPNGARILKTRIVNSDGQQVNVLRPDHTYWFQICARLERPAYRLRFGFHIKTITGFGLGGMTSHPGGFGIAYADAQSDVWANFGFQPALTPNTYFLDASVHAWGPSGGEELMHMIADADIFRIDPMEQDVASGFVRFAIPDFFSYRVETAKESGRDEFPKI